MKQDHCLGKVCYSEKGADSMAKKMIDIYISFYKCDYCPYCHLTSKKPEEKSLSTRRKR